MNDYTDRRPQAPLPEGRPEPRKPDGPDALAVLMVLMAFGLAIWYGASGATGIDGRIVVAIVMLILIGWIYYIKGPQS